MKNKFFTYEHSSYCEYCADGLKFAGYGKGMVINMKIQIINVWNELEAYIQAVENGKKQEDVLDVIW